MGGRGPRHERRNPVRRRDSMPTSRAASRWLRSPVESMMPTPPWIPASSDAATCHTADFAERVCRNQQKLASQLNLDPGQDRGVVTHRLIFPESRVAS